MIIIINKFAIMTISTKPKTMSMMSVSSNAPVVVPITKCKRDLMNLYTYTTWAITKPKYIGSCTQREKNIILLKIDGMNDSKR